MDPTKQLRPELPPTNTATQLRSPSNRRTLRLHCKRPFDMFSPDEPTINTHRPVKLLSRLKKSELSQKQIDCQRSKLTASPTDESGRKTSITTKVQGMFKKQKADRLMRNGSEQTLAVEGRKQMKAASPAHVEPFRFKYSGNHAERVKKPRQLSSKTTSSEDKLVRRMISSGLDTGASLTTHTTHTTHTLISHPAPTNKTIHDTSDEQYQISKLKMQNEFMRNLYHKLVLAKQKDRIKHAEAEAKLKRDRQMLQSELERLKSQITEIKDARKVRIDHLFTHKNYDRSKNRVGQEIKEVPFHMQESKVREEDGDAYQLELRQNSEGLIIMPQPDSECKKVYSTPVSNCQYGSKKLQLSRKRTSDEQIQPSTESATDSFCSLGLQSVDSETMITAD